MDVAGVLRPTALVSNDITLGSVTCLYMSAPPGSQASPQRTQVSPSNCSGESRLSFSP